MSKDEVELRKQDSLTFLRENVKPDMTIYSVERHNSKTSGNQSISFFYIDTTSHELVHLDSYLCRALEYKFDQIHAGLKLSGYQYNKASHVVNHLSRTLFNDPYKLKSYPI